MRYWNRGEKVAWVLLACMLIAAVYVGASW